MVRTTITTILLLGLGLGALSAETQPSTPAQILERARLMAATHRFSEALAALEPLIQDDLSDELSWEIAAEAGRAAFHQGKYAQADAILRRVVKARPIIIEPALYLEATSYVLGDHRQAFAIFEAVLQGKAEDLYLAITLPGEKQFLREPEVQRLLQQYSQPLVIRPASKRVQGIRLGQDRPEILHALGLESLGGGSSLVARAGPLVTWALSFDEDDLLAEVALNADHLRRYTPFSLDLSEGITWTSTPLDCIGSLGPPNATSATDDGAMIMTWHFPEALLDLVFSRPTRGDEGAAILEIVRLYRPTGGHKGHTS